MLTTGPRPPKEDTLAKAYFRKGSIIMGGILIGLLLSYSVNAAEIDADPWPQIQTKSKNESITVTVSGGIETALGNLSIDGEPITASWSGKLKKGELLEASNASVSVLVVWEKPQEGYVLHQYLEGPFRLEAGEDGIPKVSGTGWAHLFRTLSEALAPFTVTYDTVNTGFESTEVARLSGRNSPFLVVEGKVSLDGVDTSLVSGEWVALESSRRRIRQGSSAQMRSAIDMGSTAENLLLQQQPLCLQESLSEQVAAPLVSQLCNRQKGNIHDQLAATRLKMATQSRPPYQEMADIYMEGGRFTEAAGLYQRALESGNRSVHLELGNAHWLAGNSEAALESLRQAKIDSVNNDAIEEAHALNNFALVAGALGHFEESASAFQTLLDQDSSNLEIKAYLGKSLLELGQIPEAQKALKEAQDGGISAPWVNEAYLQALRDSDDPEAAISAAKDHLEQNMESPEAWYELGKSLLKAGKKTESYRAYERAMELEMEQAK